MVILKDGDGNPVEGVEVTCTVKDSGDSCGQGDRSDGSFKRTAMCNQYKFILVQ